MGIVVTLTDEFVPPDSDIVLKIDFREGEGSAARPFEIAAGLIKALEKIDDALVKAVDSKIETTLIVEDLRKSSIKVFLRNVLSHLDDDALKTLDWKPLVGQFLVKGKYVAIRWLDGRSRNLSDLTDEVAALAKEAAEINHIPLPAPPNPARLAQGLDEWQRAKGKFEEGESLTITLDSHDYTVDLSSDWLPSECADAIDGERELVNDQETILIVRKPDMLGHAAWQFKLGKKSLSFPLEDADWLASYQAREVVLMPQDAMHVVLRTESRFSEKGELVDTKQKIIKVLRVIPQAGGQQKSMDV